MRSTPFSCDSEEKLQQSAFWLIGGVHSAVHLPSITPYLLCVSAEPKHTASSQRVGVGRLLSAPQHPAILYGVWGEPAPAPGSSKTKAPVLHGVTTPALAQQALSVAVERRMRYSHIPTWQLHSLPGPGIFTVDSVTPVSYTLQSMCFRYNNTMELDRVVIWDVQSFEGIGFLHS